MRPDGPLYLSGDVVVRAADGRELDRAGRLALCRCGATGNAPWCDGSHRAVGFSGGPLVRRPAEAGRRPTASR